MFLLLLLWKEIEDHFFGKSEKGLESCWHYFMLIDFLFLLRKLFGNVYWILISDRKVCWDRWTGIWGARKFYWHFHIEYQDFCLSNFYRKFIFDHFSFRKVDWLWNFSKKNVSRSLPFLWKISALIKLYLDKFIFNISSRKVRRWWIFF